MSVRATGPSHSSAPFASWIVSSGAGRKPFSWNVKPAIGQRVVHPDDLAGEELAVAVDGEVGREVGRLAARQPGRLEPEALDDEQAGRADRLDRDAVAAGDDEPLLHAEPARDRGGEQEQDQARVWVSSVAIFVNWWRSP